MKTVNIHEAKTHLSRLISEDLIIARNGVPVARVTPISKAASRIGFVPADIASGMSIPDDFDTLASQEIEEMFNG